jgi:hypothetical protein
VGDDANEPIDKVGQEARAPSLSHEVARHLVSWSKTIIRWTADGERCFLVTDQGLRSAMPEDVADARERLRARRPQPPSQAES